MGTVGGCAAIWGVDGLLPLPPHDPFLGLCICAPSGGGSPRGPVVPVHLLMLPVGGGRFGGVPGWLPDQACWSSAGPESFGSRLPFRAVPASACRLGE